MTDRSLETIVHRRADEPWSLFLDRDGVINTRIIGGYVRSWAEFEFVPSVLDALRTLARWAPHVVVVTNQQGVGKGLMTTLDLDDIHDRMRRAVADAGGRIDAVQYCTHLAGDDCDCRKPQPGMATRFLEAHPEIDPSLSLMVGDTDSDIEMGRRLALITGGCDTVRIDRRDDPLATVTYASLADFAAAIAALPGEARAKGYSAE